jgi:ribonuclease HI
MSNKYYVVWKGAKTGVFDAWPKAKAQIDGRSDAQYMGFATKQQAMLAFESTYTKALMQRSLTKTPAANTVQPKNTPTIKTPSVASYSPTSQSAAIKIYCDGACSPNPGKAGTGMAVYEQNKLTTLWYGLYEANGTNNTAELNGLLQSLLLAQKYIAQQQSVHILCDSKYSIDCITKWAKGWKSKGWKRGKGEEIKNLAIIQQSYDLYTRLKNEVSISHVKAHANIEGNELADRMAVLARSNNEADFVPYSGAINVADILRMPSG